MSAPFLDFFSKLQQRQAEVAGQSGKQFQRNGASAAAIAAAAAAPTSRVESHRHDGDMPPNEPGGTSGANTSAAGDQGAASIPARQDDPAIPWAEIQAASGRVGHQLKALRAEQDQQPFNQRESYSTEHVKRLEMFKPMNDYSRPRANKLCSKDHPQPCPYGCKTCHFCRQRTTEIKTVCSMCNGVNNFYGGPARGYWCGSCLWLRIGENIDEVRDRSDWICPGCRDLCNCSGANCMRIKRGWFPTNQLSHEARDQGFRSVAHYLVHTHLSAATAAAPIADNTSHATRVAMTRQRPGDAEELMPPGKRQRTLKFNANSAREQALEQASESQLQSEIAAVLEELGAGFGSNSAGGGGTMRNTTNDNRAMSALQQLLSTAAAAVASRGQPANGIGGGDYSGLRTPSLSAPVPRNSAGFLGILDVDMMDDDEEEPQRPVPTGNGVTSNGGTGGPGGQQPARSHFGLARSGETSRGVGNDLLPPKRPSVRDPHSAAALSTDPHHQQQQQSSSTLAPPIHDINPNVAAAAASDEYLRRLVGGMGDSSFETMHQGLPGGTDEVWFQRGWGGKGATRLVIPGWARPRQSRVPTAQQQRQLQRAAAQETLVGMEDEDYQHQRQHDGENINGGAERDDEHMEGGVGRLAVEDTVQGEGQMQQVNDSEVINLAISPASNENINAAAVHAAGTEAAIRAPAVPPSSSTPAAPQYNIETEAAGAQPSQQQQEEPELPLEEASVLPPCTDAHTALAAKVSSQSTDEFVWNQLCLRASGIVHDIHALFRHHPNSPDYAGPLLGPDADVAIYEAAYDCSVEQLKAVLRDAEALMPDAVAIPNTTSATSSATTSAIGTLCTYDGLRNAVSLLTYLARLLPEGDVRWRVERRLLGAEPFADFSNSDVRARAILLHGMLELYATLHRRGLPTEDTAAAISGALACIARDMHTALPLLNAIVANQPLPEHDISIGAWQFNAEARQRRLLDLFAELSVLYASLMQALTAGMEQIMALSRAIGVECVAFLTPELIESLLGNDAKLPGSVKKDALALVCCVFDVASPTIDSSLALHMTGEERAARTAAQQKLCDIVQTSLVPALERMVQKDYPLWGDQSNRSFGSTGGLFGNRAAAAEEEHGQAEHVGGEKVETLARCYAVLVSHGRWSWPEVETRSTRPYTYSLFWRQANSTYRHFAVFILAHTLAHGPSVLHTPIFAAGGFKLWLQAVLDTGRRHCSWYLTSVLASNPSTKIFFTGVSAEQLDFRTDSTGEKRAELVGIVARNMFVDTSWKSQLAGVIGELDAVLASRKKEIETSAFDPAAALLKWESVSTRILIALLKSLASALAPTMGPGHAPVPQLRRLLNRVATWMISSCAAAHYEQYASKHGALGSNLRNPFLVPEVQQQDTLAVDDDESTLKTVADARQRLQGSAFAKLPALFEIMVAAGAPTILDADTDLLEPLWSVVAGCIELGSGDIEATPVDVAMFEILGDSLAPTNNSSSGNVESLGSSTNLSQTHQLCIYVLGTFIRRYLQRSSLRHVSHERVAVNALRLTRTILAQPSMRSNIALKYAVSVLLRPLLAALNPEGGAESSLGTKAVVYLLLSELITLHPTLLPPPQSSDGNGQSDVFENALRAFWIAVCRDALSCVLSRLTPDLAEDRMRTAQLAVRAAANNSSAPSLVFWPSTEQTKAQASNALMTALGRPRSMEAVDKLYNRPGGVPGVPSALHTIATAGGAGLFRPGDFPWKVADNAILFVRTLAASGGTNGPAWAAACFPALHHLVPGAGQASKLLHSAYRELRSALETALGPEATAAYPLATAKPNNADALGGVGNGAATGAGPSGTQEQLQPNTAASAFSGAPPPRPAAAGVRAVPAPAPSTQGRTITSDQTLTALAALPIDSTAPVTVLLQSATATTSKATGQSAVICSIKDYSGPGGTEAVAKLAAAAPAAVAALKGLRIQPGGPLPVIRLTQVRLGKRAVREYTCGLTTNESTIVEIEPQGHMADALRRTQGPQPAISQEAECPAAPVHAAPQGMNNGLQSQTTQAQPPRAEYKVKSEQKSAVAGPSTTLLGQEDLHQAHTQLVGMGFSSQVAKAAVLAVMRDKGAGWKQLSFEQFIDALIQKASV